MICTVLTCCTSSMLFIYVKIKSITSVSIGLNAFKNESFLLAAFCNAEWVDVVVEGMGNQKDLKSTFVRTQHLLIQTGSERVEGPFPRRAICLLMCSTFALCSHANFLSRESQTVPAAPSIPIFSVIRMIKISSLTLVLSQECTLLSLYNTTVAGLGLH